MRFLFFFLLLAGTATASNIDFISNDLTAARFKAQKSGKLIIVKFYADWCAPCKVMDEYVWTEPDLVDYVEQNCVAAKIDVDNFDGLNYKQHFSIERLPTTLILDACGNEVARYENYVSPNRMMSWIQLFDKKEHRTCPEGNSVAMPEAFLTTDKPVPGAVLDSVEVPKPPVSPEVAFVDNITKPTETAVAPGQSPDKNQKWRIFKKKKEEPAPTQSETGLAKPVADNHNLATAKPEIYPSTHPEELTPTTTGEPVLFPQPFRPAPATFAAPAASTGTGIFW